LFIAILALNYVEERLGEQATFSCDLTDPAQIVLLCNSMKQLIYFPSVVLLTLLID